MVIEKFDGRVKLPELRVVGKIQLPEKKEKKIAGKNEKSTTTNRKHKRVPEKYAAKINLGDVMREAGIKFKGSNKKR